MFFQFVDKDKNVRVLFYKLVQLGVLSTGQAYQEALEKELKSDGLWDHMKEHLVALGNIEEGFQSYLMINDYVFFQ